MKKNILIFSFLTFCIVAFSQSQKVYEYRKEFNVEQKAYKNTDKDIRKTLYVPSPDTIPLVNITNNKAQGANGWAINGNVCAGCASYFYKILRTKTSYKAEDGLNYYYYYFYFYSNSFLNDKTYTNTYLKDINFLVDGETTFSIPYLLLEVEKVVYGAWIRSLNPFTNVEFNVTNISVY